jgi:uncharacterized membrane-anchored protein
MGDQETDRDTRWRRTVNKSCDILLVLLLPVWVLAVPWLLFGAVVTSLPSGDEASDAAGRAEGVRLAITSMVASVALPVLGVAAARVRRQTALTILYLVCAALGLTLIVVLMAGSHH